MAFNFVFISDKNKFLDRSVPGAKPMTLEQFKNHLKLIDDKYQNDEKALNEMVASTMTIGAVSSDDLKAEREARKQKKPSVSFAAIWEDMRALVPLYKRTNRNGQSQIFFVAENNEVSKIDYTDNDTLVDALMHRKETFRQLREYYNTSPMLEELRDKLGLKPFLIRMLTEHMMVDERHLFDEDPLQISWEAEDYAYKKMDIGLLEPGETPTWDEFTARLDYPGVFMAWVWSIFEPTNNIRQVLWLRGAGNDGKSSVQKAIEQVIGRDYCYSMKPGDEVQQWFQKNVFGKVLVNYADCRNQFLIQNDNIKQLTGGDTTSIEGKGENSFTGKIYSKLLVTSNFHPKINPENQAQMTRLIKIEVSPQAEVKKDAGFELRLQAEIYAFLYKCRDAFEALISKGYEKLLLPDELVERMKIDCASYTYLNVQDFVQDHIVFGPNELCNPADLNRISKEYFLNEKNVSMEQCKHHTSELEAKLHAMGCIMLRHGEDDAQITMWQGFRLNADENKLKIVK